MRLNDEALVFIGEIFESYSVENNEKYFVANKKKIKYLVDTLCEQLVEIRFGEKPRYPVNARQIINKNLHLLAENEDKLVFESLDEVLRCYDVISSKKYIDVKIELEPVLTVQIRKLCINIILHSAHRENQQARALRKLLQQNV